MRMTIPTIDDEYIRSILFSRDAPLYPEDDDTPEVISRLIEWRNEALRAQAKAILAAAPEKREHDGAEWHPKAWCRRNDAIDEYTTTIKRIGGLS